MRLTTRLAGFVFAFASFALAQPVVDNVLERMVPPGATSLIGAHMDQIRQTDFYRKLLAAQAFPQIDQFAKDTGFNPRRDVRELLFVQTPRGSVMLTRGAFHLSSEPLKGMTKTRHGEYDIWGRAAGGFCILDSTLAVAGDVAAIETVLDEWKSGTHTGAQPLLARAAGVNPQSQFWGVSTGFGDFLADHAAAFRPGLDLSKLFRGLEDTSFQADLSAGIRAEIRGTTATEKDAMNLRDAVRGLVGLGRLQVPENQPELLRVWDGVTADQQGRSIIIHADIAQDLFNRLIQMLDSSPSGPRHVI